MEEVEEVLVQLDLAEYIDVFKRNKITYTRLLQLTDEDINSLIQELGPARDLKGYLNKLKNGEVFKCYICLNGCLSSKLLLTHFTEEHGLGTSSTYRCIHCPDPGLFNRPNYRRHLRNIARYHKGLFRSADQEHATSSPRSFGFVEPLFQSRQDTKSKTINDYYEAGAIFKAKILQSGKVPLSVADSIFDALKSLVGVGLDLLEGLVKTNIELKDQSCLVSQIEQLRNPFKEIDSKHKLDAYLSREGKLVLPRKVVLDTDLVSKQGNQGYKDVSFQYVSIRENLALLFRQPGFSESLILEREHSECIQHFRDGELGKKILSMTTDRVLFINIYSDELETGNPLGTRAGIHKLSNFYLQVLDLQPHLLSSPLNYLLVASVKVDDLKLFHPNAVVGRIVDELIDLWDHGIFVLLDGKEVKFRVCLAQLLGDNLSIHSLLGFSEGFTANYPCRKCKMFREECRTACRQDDTLLRNTTNYDYDLDVVKDFSKTGVRFKSEINRLPYHHVTNMWVFDVMHDILEGVAPDLVKNIISRLVNRKILDLDTLNSRIECFGYGKHYSNSKPNFITPEALKEGKLAQSASQMYCLLLCLPLMIGDLVSRDDESWELFLVFREIVDLVMSPSITTGGISYLGHLISEFLSRYQLIFTQHLKPKFHHLVHYPDAIRFVGPLKYCWAMTGESKHKFFKSVSHMCCNFKNIAYTTSYRHQLHQCFYFMSVGFLPKLVAKSYEVLALNDYLFKDLLPTTSDCESDIVKITRKIEHNGSVYEIGTVVLLEISDEGLIFGQVKSILLKTDDTFLLVDEFKSKFSKHFHSWKLDKTGNSRFINLNSKWHHLPLYVMKSCKINCRKVYVVFPYRYF